MLEKVKTALRVKNAAFDEEIEGLIAACKADLRLAGIILPEDKQPAESKTPIADDPLITRAIILYCKANYGFLSGSEQFRAAYELLKHSLSLAGDYNDVE